MSISYSKSQTEKETLSKRVVTDLRNDIILEKYPAGSRLLELDLSKNYNVSRGTIRSALQDLSNEGLVEFLDTGGCIAVGLDEKTIRDTYQFRNILEIQAAETFLTDDHFSYTGMLSVLDDFLIRDSSPVYQENPAEYCVDTDLRFHRAMMYASKNRPIYRAWCSMSSIIRTLMLINMTDDYRSAFEERFYRNHRTIVDKALMKDKTIRDEIEQQSSSGVNRSIRQLEELRKNSEKICC